MAVSLTIVINQNSQSVADNTSNVTVKVNASWTYGSYNKLQKSGYLIIDGTKYTFTSSFNTGQSTSGTQTLFTKTVNVKHGSDGKKTLTTSASYTTGVSSGTIAASASKALTTIPRKSTLAASNGTLGTAQTLTVTKQSSGFTHTITYKCGTASGTVCTKSSSTSVSFTPPLSLASQNTTGTSVSVTFTITTYNGDTSLGANTKTISCAIPASVKPSCTVTVTDPTGYADKYGSYVKGLSKFKVVVTPTTSYGSAIALYSTSANGATYTAASFTTGVINAAGTATIKATVKDKRGRSGTASASKTVIGYTVPVVVKLEVRRCTEDGTLNDKGEYVQATFSAQVTALNNLNTAAYVLKYKKSSETAYTEVGLDEYENMYTITDKAYIFPADSGSSYDVELTVSDSHNSTSRTTSASTGFTLMHFGSDGKSIGLGKIAENPLDIGLDTCFHNPVWGKVTGLDKLPAIPSNSDFNDYMETGCHAVYRNAEAATIANMPVQRAGRLEVISATGEGIRVSEWSYIRQRFTPYNSDNAVWERDITRSEDNVWRYYDWNRVTLTPEIAARVYRLPKLLWNGGYFMTSGHTVTLSEAISKQNNGIVLGFSAYTDGAVGDYWWHNFFVPKSVVVDQPGTGHCFTMAAGNFSLVAMKYLMISDTKITGHNNNNLEGTAASGITYTNSRFVLRYVLGV